MGDGGRLSVEYVRRHPSATRSPTSTLHPSLSLTSTHLNLSSLLHHPSPPPSCHHPKAALHSLTFAPPAAVASHRRIRLSAGVSLDCSASDLHVDTRPPSLTCIVRENHLASSLCTPRPSPPRDRRTHTRLDTQPRHRHSQSPARYHYSPTTSPALASTTGGPVHTAPSTAVAQTVAPTHAP